LEWPWRSLDATESGAPAEADIIDLNAAMLEVGGNAVDAAASADVDLNAPMFSGSELVVEAQPIVFDEPVVDFAAAPVDLREEASAFEAAEPKPAADDLVLDARAQDAPSLESTLAQFEQSGPVETSPSTSCRRSQAVWLTRWPRSRRCRPRRCRSPSISARR
jgi:hypothetical protein